MEGRHSGLGLEHYCHCTSGLRRAADIVAEHCLEVCYDQTPTEEQLEELRSDIEEKIRIINEKQYKRLSGLLEEGEILFGGKTDAVQKYISPTLIKPYSFDITLMQEEIFGPLLPVIEYENIEEVVRFVNSRPHPLALYYFGKQNADIIQKTISGGACINDAIMHIIPHNLPFGGIGQSGMGAYHGKKSFETFSHYKSILKTNRDFEFNFKYQPYTKLKQKIIKFFLK
jgi:delta 1-pyrroline-5-carboxylate dehydrogenase